MMDELCEIPIGMTDLSALTWSNWVILFHALCDKLDGGPLELSFLIDPQWHGDVVASQGSLPQRLGWSTRLYPLKVGEAN